MMNNFLVAMEPIIENILLYIIYLVGSFSFAKFIKEEDRYYNDRKRYIILSGVVFVLLSFINLNIVVRVISFSLVISILLNQIMNENIKWLIGSNLYIITVSSIIAGILKALTEIKIYIIEFIVLIILLILDCFIYKFNFNISLVKGMDRKNIIRIFLSYTSLIIMLIMSIYACSSNSKMYTDICLYILMFAFFILINTDIINRNKLSKDLIYIENLEKDKIVLTKENDKIKIFKHDFNNIIQAMSGYIQTEDIPALKTYVKKMVRDVNDIDEINLGNKYFLNNKAIANLLGRKYAKAKKENVNIKFEIMFELSLLNKYEYELVRILGIFLDNSIEAIRDEEDKDIEVLFFRNGNVKSIIIENCCTKEIDINKIYTKEFSTKKGNSGIGLWEVKNIISKNSNFTLETICENNRFKQRLIIE